MCGRVSARGGPRRVQLSISMANRRLRNSDSGKAERITHEPTASAKLARFPFDFRSKQRHGACLVIPGVHTHNEKRGAHSSRIAGRELVKSGLARLRRRDRSSGRDIIRGLAEEDPYGRQRIGGAACLRAGRTSGRSRRARRGDRSIARHCFRAIGRSGCCLRARVALAEGSPHRRAEEPHSPGRLSRVRRQRRPGARCDGPRDHGGRRPLYILKPRRWEVQGIRNFMLWIGPLPLGFALRPPALFLVFGVATATYLILVEVVKRRLVRRLFT